LHEKNLPAFTFTSPRIFEIIDEDQSKFQVFLEVTNQGEADGLIGVNFRWGDGGNTRRMLGVSGPENLDLERRISVKAGQSKEVGMVLGGAPRAVIVNTYLSRNLPKSQELQFVEQKKNEDAKPFEGTRVLDHPQARHEQGTIIVDNEDPGFEIHSFESESYLEKLLDISKDDQQEYIGLQQWKVPARWSNAMNNGFYGEFRRSAHYIKAGKGENKVSWKAELPRSGKYDVYYYVTESLGGMWRRGRQGRGGGKPESPAKDFHFTVHHDDGAEELKLDADGAEPGWYLLGTFYFSEGTALVELTDLSKGRMVYADAVKWVERE
ncbi:MAG: hypothetical protein U9N45_05485, partial [Gemmatimonadota bacterium]|nr:hypothetical protein [Gemmatimonadota bacterium]